MAMVRIRSRGLRKGSMVTCVPAKGFSWDLGLDGLRPAPCRYGQVVQDILKCKQEGRSQDALADFGSNSYRFGQ